MHFIHLFIKFFNKYKKVKLQMYYLSKKKLNYSARLMTFMYLLG